MKFKKAIPYAINIEATSNGGFYVRCGCAHFAFETSTSLLIALKEYLDNPEQVEEEYDKSNISQNPTPEQTP